jgi:formate-dependent nitrite reductase membrane component NrfD
MTSRPKAHKVDAVPSFLKGVAGAVITETIIRTLDRNDVPVPASEVMETSNKVVDAINEDIAEQKVAIVPVQSEWFSKTVWTQIVGVGLMLLTMFGVDIDPQLQSEIVSAIVAVVGVLTFVLKKWFTSTITASSS